jgi:hypothetical protein
MMPPHEVKLKEPIVSENAPLPVSLESKIDRFAGGQATRSSPGEILDNG